MHVLAPFSLLALVPWLGVAVYLLRGARESSRVPFLPLWRGTEAQPRTHRRLRPPPLPIALALLATLLAILAAARPAFTASSARAPLVLIVDRGINMSARGPSGYRFVEATNRVADALRRKFSDADVELMTVPASPSHGIRLSEVWREVQALSPTACDTVRALSDVIAAHSNENETLIVVTDQDVSDPRVIRVAPAEVVQDVGITRVAVRDAPTTQAMVELRNQSNRSKATVRVSSGDVQRELEVELPAAPGVRSYFFDLPSVTDTVRAQILGADDNTANNLVWSVREKAFPRIEPRSPLPPAVSRMIDAYGRARPGSDSSRVLVAADSSALPPGEKGAIVLPAQEPAQAPIVAADHEITRHVHWQSLVRVKTVNAPPPAGWTPILTAGASVLAAIKPEGARQAWIAFDAEGWETTTDFVVFWTNVFDYLGATDSAGFVSHPLSDWTPEWRLDRVTPGQWPGLYTRADGQQRAFVAPDVIAKTPPQTDWQSRLSRVTETSGATEFSPALFLSALACLLGSLALWRR